MPLLIIVLSMPGLVRPCHAAQYNDFQTWWDITTTYRFTDRFRYDGDLGTRGIVSNEPWTTAYVRPSARYDVRPWFLLHGGFAFFYTFRDFPGDVLELRPWIGFRFIWPKPGGFTISHYFRFEDRNTYSEFRDTWDHVVRVRYQIATKSPKFGVAGVENLYGVAGFEIFKDLRGQIFERFANRSRLGGGLGKAFGRSFSAEMHYIYQSSVFFVKEGGRTDEHILRLRLSYTIK
ncbi:MAG: DUF2490 domain-containing protein [bacterium]